MFLTLFSAHDSLLSLRSYTNLNQRCRIVCSIKGKIALSTFAHPTTHFSHRLILALPPPYNSQQQIT